MKSGFASEALKKVVTTGFKTKDGWFGFQAKRLNQTKVVNPRKRSMSGR